MIDALNAAEITIKAQTRRREAAKCLIRELHSTDPKLYFIFNKISEGINEASEAGLNSLTFNVLELFLEEKFYWEVGNTFSQILNDLGFEVEYSFSSNFHNETRTLRWSLK